MTPASDLQTALDAAYGVFAGYPAPKVLSAPSYRKPKRLLARLTAKPLALLTTDDIGPYTGWAMTTVGVVDDYKHFLPRILELAAEGSSTHLCGDPELLANRIMYGGFPKWPDKERAAILAVYDAAWRQASRASPEEVDAEEWLQGLIELGEPIETRLAAWIESNEIKAGLQLATAVCLQFVRHEGPRNITVDGARADYAVWLAGPAVRQRLERLILEVDDEAAWQVGQALGLSAQALAELRRG